MWLGLDASLWASPESPCRLVNPILYQLGWWVCWDSDDWPRDTTATKQWMSAMRERLSACACKGWRQYVATCTCKFSKLIFHSQSLTPTCIPTAKINTSRCTMSCNHHKLSEASTHSWVKHPCTKLQGVTVATSIQTYGKIPSKHPCKPKYRVMFKYPWVLTRDQGIIYLS